MPEGSIISALIAAAVSCPLGAYLKYRYDRRLRREFDAPAEIVILKDRAHLYRTVAEILRGAKSDFIDTTWCQIARVMAPGQEEALKEYLRERDFARVRGVECHELFAGEGRESRVAAAKTACKSGNLLIKVVDPGVKLPYIPDFAVADTRHLVISNVGATKAGKARYMYIQSEGLAQMFHDWYWECWMKLPGEEVGRHEEAPACDQVPPKPETVGA